MGQCCSKPKAKRKATAVPNTEIHQHTPMSSRERLASAAENRLQQSTYRGASTTQGKLSERLMKNKQNPVTYEKIPSKEDSIVDMVSYIYL
jgi:hypothetical protein